jgi:putative flippase GtrA
MSFQMQAGRFHASGAKRIGMLRAAPGGTVQLRRFAVVGALNTGLDYVLFIALTKLLRLPLDWVWLAKAVSGTIAMANSFYLNRSWVFGIPDATITRAVRFLTATIVGVYLVQTSLTQLFATTYPQAGEEFYDVLRGAGLTSAFPTVFTEALAIKTSAFVIATCFSMTFNFAAYKFWVFRTSERC